MKRLILTALALAFNITRRLMISLIILASVGATTVNASRESLNWGFIRSDVTMPSGGTVRFLSKVFVYCGDETVRKAILMTNETALREEVRKLYGDKYEITHNSVDTFTTEDNATSARNKELNTTYLPHQGWQANTSDYSRCK